MKAVEKAIRPVHDRMPVLLTPVALNAVMVWTIFHEPGWRTIAFSVGGEAVT